MRENEYWVYILFCNNGHYYTGYTNDLMRRYQEHVSGSTKCKYTRSFKPLGIAQCWRVMTNKNEAMRIEKFIKKLTRAQKEKIIAKPSHLEQLFPGCAYQEHMNTFSIKCI